MDNSPIDYNKKGILARMHYHSSSLRCEYNSSFYFEPLSPYIIHTISGISFHENKTIAYSDLAYLHVLHYDFRNKSREGELICNRKIASCLLFIFLELYRNRYQIEKIRLIDTYKGDDTASCLDNNTSCFNYRTIEGTNKLSMHAYGLAVDINPVYNPYITYSNQMTHISPVGSEIYADRKKEFLHKIDENDLCYQLFDKASFIWGGHWLDCKDYQHFEYSQL